MVYKASILVLDFYFTTHCRSFVVVVVVSLGSFVVVVLCSRLLPDRENKNVSIFTTQRTIHTLFGEESCLRTFSTRIRKLLGALQ